MNKLLAVGLAVAATRVLWDRIPYTLPATRIRRWHALRYHTILTQGVQFRGRVRGRLYSADFWREHGENRNRP